MTTGERLDLNSSVSNVSALIHLLNPLPTGTGDCISFSARGSFAVKLKTIDFSMSGSRIGFKPEFGTVLFDNGNDTKGFTARKIIHKFKIGDCNE